jgi:hypothetical protein
MRTSVMTVFGSAVEVVEQYVAEIRPCFGAPRHPAMFLTERGTRIALAHINVALVGAPNLTAMNARSRSETRLSPRLQVFVPPARLTYRDDHPAQPEAHGHKRQEGRDA